MIIPRHTTRDRSCKAPFVKQIAVAVGLLMMLMRVVNEVLLPFREHDTIDLSFSVTPRKHNLLLHLSQPRPKSSNRPLQLPTGRHDGLLMPEVPHTSSPVLQIDESQLRSGPNVNLNSPAMKPRTVPRVAGRLRQQRRLGTLFQNNDRSTKVSTILRHGTQHVKRFIHNNAPRNVKQSATRPTSRMQGRKLVRLRINNPIH